MPKNFLKKKKLHFFPSYEMVKEFIKIMMREKLSMNYFKKQISQIFIFSFYHYL